MTDADELDLGVADGMAYVDVDQQDDINRVDLVVRAGDELVPVHCENRPPSGRYVLARVDPRKVEAEQHRGIDDFAESDGGDRE